MVGEGETQLEIERRTIGERESKLKKELIQIEENRIKLKTKQNKLFNSLPRIALIGYTNAGKSALLNCIAKGEEVESKDMLF